MTPYNILLDQLRHRYLKTKRNDSPSEDELKKQIEHAANYLTACDERCDKHSYSDLELNNVLKEIHSQFEVEMDIGNLFSDSNSSQAPWLSKKKNDINWYYFDRYKEYLHTEKGFPKDVVFKLDKQTDDILDKLGDPTRDESWSTRGMVVGHVQSGKTANFTGVICKAADAGYKVIIILAGMLNDLRKQTQIRLESDFMGFCTNTKKNIGVGDYSKGTNRRPHIFTSVHSDFNKTAADSNITEIDAVNRSMVFVVKKNKAVLTALYEWLNTVGSSSDSKIINNSLLMIDDESDHATVDTSKPDSNTPTAINNAIRQILSLFKKNTYVGYTATPFANIFIDPANEHEMLNGTKYSDLFPKHFIYSLDAPSNYVGPDQLFGENGSHLDCVSRITDIPIRQELDGQLHIKHKKDFSPDYLPHSLDKALRSFILIKAIRLLRGQVNKHNTMMINVSRFTDVQNKLAIPVSEKIKSIVSAIKGYSQLSSDEAASNIEMKILRLIWIEEFQNTEFEWITIQRKLIDSIQGIEVVAINSISQERLNYDQYESGRTVIAIGGLVLSRGLTLEGLTVSYFARNSIMYDTLMQMGRWFGYRPGHAELCRIFMTDEAIGWYSYITEATNELRADFKRMERARLSPAQFGLRVKDHPLSLIVTAKNKMRSAQDTLVEFSYEGELIQTFTLIRDPDVVESNKTMTDIFIRDLQANYSTPEHDKGYTFTGIPMQKIKSYIDKFTCDDASNLAMNKNALCKYIQQLEETNTTGVVYIKTHAKSDNHPLLDIGDKLYGKRVLREGVEEKVSGNSGSIYYFNNRNITNESDESAGLSKEVIRDISNKKQKRILFRRHKTKQPLLIIYPLDITDAREPFIGFAISFPGDKTNPSKKLKKVSYMLNKTYVKQYQNEIEELEEVEKFEEQEAKAELNRQNG